MTAVGGFLGSAKGRLLPASVPFRFFGAAALFHAALWVAVVLAATDLVGFRGGIGPSLAAVHLLTLGVLTATAIGAAVQLLPVATTRPLAAVWPIKLSFWLVIPGTVALIAGMAAIATAPIIAGAAISALGLVLFAAPLGANLRGAASMPVVRAYGWAAAMSLVLLIALGLALSFDDRSGFLADHAGIALAHMLLGGLGFMGLLAFGFSHILIPMFALSYSPEPRLAGAGFVAAVAAVASAVAGALSGARPLLTAACVIGAGAVGLHLALMHKTLRSGMRKRLGLSFVLVRASWAALALTPLCGLAALYGWAGAAGPTLFGLVLLGGWLLTFVLGILQRIVPFLASMHISRSTGGPPLLTEIGLAAPLKLHAACHAAAIAGLAAAILLDQPHLARLAGAIGLIGSLAFALNIASVLNALRPRPTRTPVH